MEGSDPKEKLKSTYVEALKKNWMVWPPVQAINFKFVPLEHRVLVVNVVSLGEWASDWKVVKWESADCCTGWNCYLSYVNSQAGTKGDDRGAKVRIPDT